MTETSFLSVQNLVMAFGAVKAVDDIGFSVGRREHVTLLGPSGCGKTTTLRAIAGLETPRSGRITIDSAAVYDSLQGINAPPERRALGMVFQSYAIWPHMTVFDNVAFSFKVRGIPREKAKAAVDRALALVDLAGFADRPATKLSGGQQQRVALARAIAFESKVILFDEPLSNLDAQLRVTMRAELAALRERLGFTAIYVTHDQEEAFALSDRILIMRAGRIEQQGTPAEIHAAPRSRFVAAFLGVKNIFDAALAPTGNGTVEARLADDLVLKARQPQGVEHGAAVSFRPINVRLSLDNAPGQGGSGVISRRLFLGDLVQYTVRSAGLDIHACDRPRPDLAEGTNVHWRIDPEHCLVLGA
jgi:ABC-type Fe3+/spermidine/putrescine transport system ATPase subunit